jgi:hypothetical protein
MPTPIIRGDTKKWALAFVDDIGDPLDLSGCTVWFTAKVTISNDMLDEDAIIQHKIEINGSGGVVETDGFLIGGKHPVTGVPATTAAEGVLTQVLSAAESTLLASGEYIYDIQIRTPLGEVYTPVLGQTVSVVEDITRQSV